MLWRPCLATLSKFSAHGVQCSLQAGIATNPHSCSPPQFSLLDTSYTSYPAAVDLFDVSLLVYHTDLIYPGDSGPRFAS